MERENLSPFDQEQFLTDTHASPQSPQEIEVADARFDEQHHLHPAEIAQIVDQVVAEMTRFPAEQNTVTVQRNEQRGNEREIRLDGQKVLFIDPPIFSGRSHEKLLDDGLKGAELPKGAHSIASYLQKLGAETGLAPLDAYLRGRTYSDEPAMYPDMLAELDRLTQAEDPAVISIGAMYTFTVPSVLAMTRHLKARYPEKTILVGGNHAMHDSFALIDPGQATGIDYVVCGEGELTTAELLAELATPSPDLSQVQGIAYVDGEGIPRKTAPRQRSDLRHLPPLDYKLIRTPAGMDLTDFNHTVMYTRGCEAACSFCTSPASWGREITKPRWRNFAREVFYLAKQGVRNIGLLDDDILVGAGQGWRELAPIVARVHAKYPDVSFFAQTRVKRMVPGKQVVKIDGERQLVDWTADAILDEMKEAGVKRIYLGIESGSQKILDCMAKGYQVEEAYQACQIIKAHGIEVGAFWIIGHPGSSPAEEEASLAFLERLLQEGLVDDVEAHIAVPFPGTAMAKDPRIRFNERAKDYANFGIVGSTEPIYALVAYEEKNPAKGTLVKDKTMEYVPVLDPATGAAAVVMSEAQIKAYHQRATALRRQYLGIDEQVANSPIS